MNERNKELEKETKKRDFKKKKKPNKTDMNNPIIIYRYYTSIWGWAEKVHWLKRLYDDIISALVDFIDQWDPSTATPME